MIAGLTAKQAAAYLGVSKTHFHGATVWRVAPASHNRNTRGDAATPTPPLSDSPPSGFVRVKATEGE